MTAPELVDFRIELIQTAATIVSAIEDIDVGVAWAGDSEETTERILGHIMDERHRQDEKWGPQTHRWSDWLALIGEELGESNTAYVDNILIPTKIEQERIGLEPPMPVKWGLGPNLGLEAEEEYQ